VQKHQQQQQQPRPQQPPEVAQQLQQSLIVNGSTEQCRSNSSSSSSRPALPPLPAEADGLDVVAGPLPDSSIQNKALEKALMASSKPLYEAMVCLVWGCEVDCDAAVPGWGGGGGGVEVQCRV
jgi:hypothetical protein